MSYRDYLDERKVPRGPWCTNVNDENLKNKPDDKKVVQLRKRVDKTS